MNLTAWRCSVCAWAVILGVNACGGGDSPDATPVPPRTYDLSAEFSLAANPNGVWQYGYTPATSLAADQFRLSQLRDTSDAATGFWHPSAAGYYPYVANNTATVAHADPSNGWAVRPGQVAMEGAGNGQYSMIRFISPAAARYRVVARFEGIHFHLSSTDVHVLVNGESLFAADIEGYGGDPAFHAVSGSNPAADYQSTLALNAGDVLSFAVGYGRNQTNFNDTTGLTLHITTVP